MTILDRKIFSVWFSSHNHNNATAIIPGIIFKSTRFCMYSQKSCQNFAEIFVKYTQKKKQLKDIKILLTI